MSEIRPTACSSVVSWATLRMTISRPAGSQPALNRFKYGMEMFTFFRSRLMQRRWITALVVTIPMLAAGAAIAQNLELSDTGEFLDGIAAVVNDGMVLKSELEDQTTIITQRLREMNTELPPPAVLRRQVLERLVLTRIQLQRAEDLGIRVADVQLNQALARVAERNGIPFEDMPDTLDAQGIDYAAYREEMRREMIVEQLRRRDVASGIRVSPREIDRFLARQEENKLENAEFNLSHILLSLPAAASPEQVEEVRERVEQIREQAMAGEEFSSLAVTYSDSQDALEGGQLGWRKGLQLPTIVTSYVESLEPGEITEPIRSASGFHLFRLNEVRGIGPVIVDQTHLRHILITPNEVLDEQAALQQLVEIRERIVGGEDFGELAQLYSDDPASKSKGGDLGWQSPGTFVPQFEEVATALEPGEISDPFQTPFGWHILQVLDRRTHDNTEEVRENQAYLAIRDNKLEEETQLWVRQLRDEAYVDIRI
ncbi:MAG: peptidylprolyl isomerase [Gammaproteobacteria bacterium]